MASTSNSIADDGASAPNAGDLKALADRLIESEALGRSGHMRRLFNYLVDCSIAGRTPKETEVAIDVFGKKPSFDVAQDAMVRVYVHKLRKRIEQHYDRSGGVNGWRLIVPRGDYRIEVVQGQEQGANALEEAPQDVTQAPECEESELLLATPSLNRKRYLLPALAATLVLSLLLNAIVTLRPYWNAHPSGDGIAATAANPVWSRLLEGNRNIYVVLGDYYMFAETDTKMQVQRLVRDSAVNSPHELLDYMRGHPEMEGRYHDVRANYLPTSTAYGLREVLRVLSPALDRVHIEMASDLTPSMMASSDVVYVGYMNGMGMLGSMLSSGSRFSVDSASDEIVDHRTGTHYLSQAAMPLPGVQRYRDYGYFATFIGPRGNQTIVIAGTRDEGVMYTADAATHRTSLEQLNRGRSNRSFEALYDVLSMDGTDLDGKLLFTSALDFSKVWAGEGASDGPASPSTAALSHAAAPMALVDSMQRH